MVLLCQHSWDASAPDLLSEEGERRCRHDTNELQHPPDSEAYPRAAGGGDALCRYYESPEFRTHLCMSRESTPPRGAGSILALTCGLISATTLATAEHPAAKVKGAALAMTVCTLGAVTMRITANGEAHAKEKDADKEGG